MNITLNPSYIESQIKSIYLSERISIGQVPVLPDQEEVKIDKDDTPNQVDLVLIEKRL